MNFDDKIKTKYSIYWQTNGTDIHFVNSSNVKRNYLIQLSKKTNSRIYCTIVDNF